jgi:DNA-binding transcriptional MerR regulator/methylmalonyl-CoA mutase cobalamin-binding subunit
MVDKQGFYSIGDVERDTGIGRDTLRIWERRYGFPAPDRNSKGERIYSESQLRRLQRIRRLLDQGMRPGKLLPIGDRALDQLEAGMLTATIEPRDETIQKMLECIYSADSVQLETVLHAQLKKQGMQNFILAAIVPLLEVVGEHWASGRLQIYQEHFVSQLLIRFVNSQIDALAGSAKQSMVLLATLPGEQHTLGLLLVAALLMSQGKKVINLGAEVPMDQVAHAVKQFNADTLGITFSGAYQYKHIRSDLCELRDLLPANVEIWAGGKGVHRLRKLPGGISRVVSLRELATDSMKQS